MQGKTFWAGALLCAIGVTAAVLASNYRMGTLMQMGPGYFPLILGVLLGCLGAVTCLSQVLAGGSDRLAMPPIRQLLLLPLSIVCFALLVERAGLAIAVLATVLIGCLGGNRFRLVEALASAVVLAALTSMLFVSLLGLPVSIFPSD